MKNRISAVIAWPYVEHIQLLMTPLLEPLIVPYIQSLQPDIQNALRSYANRWMLRHWNYRSQSLKFQKYLASVGQNNKRTLDAFLYIRQTLNR